MPRTTIPGTWETGRSFAPAVITTGGRIAWLAGIGHTVDDEGNTIRDFAGQVHATFREIARILDQCGATLADVATMTVYVADPRYGNEFVELRKAWFSDAYPSSTLITVAGFARPEMLVEVTVTAVLDDA
jgi:enamine deaminase RidA (YjgF/YER057c/UK114 family)